MPNAWDAGSAILLAEAGFAAIATTSAGIAAALGKADFLVPEGATAVSRSQMFDRVHQIVSAVDIPVSGDLENGYGDKPEEVAETIRLAIDAGLAGASIEDHHSGAIYDDDLAVERIVAAKEAASGTDFVLTARTDYILLRPADGLSAAVRRFQLFAETGADCLYAPAVNDPAILAALVGASETPINAIMGRNDTVAGLGAAGVARISLGSGISRAVLGFIRDCARELLDQGTMTFADRQISHPDLNAVFARRELSRP
ncbi:isocitrate lyase/phosphoenolpyruvate mutase family protein [Fodinicola feengrottensis]|uniref:Isocitrate lyase/phosphoenolpyruvate mutase family protein n=2 Tax=Fodinicola feengrottensis TaxID=435914 RepID=A0ABN2IJE1_9ACTN